MIVADVHLVAYLLLGGPEAHLAQRVLERDPAWAAPILWRSEFRSILAAYMRKRNLSVPDAWHAHELAQRLLGGNEFGVSGELVLQLVAGSSCSAYDCEYVALARELQVPLVTLDGEVLREFPGVALTPKAYLQRGAS